MKNTPQILTWLLLVVVMLLSACTPPVAAPATPVPATPVPGTATPDPAKPVSTLAELLAALKASGATVEEGEVMQEEFFSSPGRQYKLNGASISIWEFPDEAAQQAALATIQGGGFIIGNMAVDWIDLPHFYGQGRLIALYVGKDQATIDLLTRLLGPVVNPQVPAGGMMDFEQSPFTQAAKAALAEKLGIPQDDIVYISAEPVEWPNACLGLPNPDELCAEVITPGYRVSFEARGGSYEVRTDETGSTIRIQP